MFIVFTGLSYSGKKDFHQKTADYLLEKHPTPSNDVMVIADPKSTKIGELVASLNSRDYNYSRTEEGLMYLSASVNVYNEFIQKAVNFNKHIVCRGYFAEILAYQGNLNGNFGFNWEMLKTFYENSLKITNLQSAIKYPDILFICTSSFSQAKLLIDDAKATGFEANLSLFDYNNYTAQFIESYEVIKEDKGFCAHTKAVLIDSSNYSSKDAWTELVKPEIDSLIGTNVLGMNTLFSDYEVD